MATTKSNSHELNRHIGHRIATRRRLRGLSREVLGALTELGTDRVRRLEDGRVEATVLDLYHLSRVLDVAVRYFFLEAPTPPEWRDDEPAVLVRGRS